MRFLANFIVTICLVLLAIMLYNARDSFSPLPAGQMIWEKPTTAKEIYLTIDDTPSRESLPLILSTLKKHSATAVFFVIGKFGQEYPEGLKAIAQGGYRFGNHTFNHVNGLQVNKAEIKNELELTDKTIFENTGKHAQYFRPPFGFFNYRYFQAAKSMNYPIVFWTGDAGDWNQMSAPELLERMMASTAPGAILLLHDLPMTAQVLDAYLTSIEALGYRTGTL